LVEHTIPIVDGGSIPAPPHHFLAIEKRKATELIIEHHYLHRKCPISWCWGIEAGGKILGVMTVGKPCSWSATCGVVGEKYAAMKNPEARSKDVYELNRLWVSDLLPRNTESQFVGWCLRQLRVIQPNVILISYADSSRKNPNGIPHIGTVYQATKWIYTGTSSAFTDITFAGYSNSRNMPLEKRGARVGNKGARLSDPTAIRTTRSPKHRYVWFANSEDKRLLAWLEKPYPTRDGSQRGICSDCGATFPSNRQRRKHIEREHTVAEEEIA
jgi:hypothetical protein